MNRHSQNFKPISFIIPSDGNRITANDIKNKKIRITAAFKPLFPENDSELKIRIKNDHYLRFKNRDTRSHFIRLSNEAFEELGFKAGGKIVFVKIGTKTFKLEIGL